MHKLPILMACGAADFFYYAFAIAKSLLVISSVQAAFANVNSIFCSK